MLAAAAELALAGRVPGARGRLVGEIAAHAADDGRGHASAVGGVAELGFFAGIGDEAGLDQHRRHVRRTQHHEVRALDLRLVRLADLLERSQHFAGDVVGDAHGGVLGQVEQHGGEVLVARVEFDAAHEVGGVFLVGQPARRFGRRAAQRQHVHRRAVGGAVVRGVGVDGNEEVGLCLAGAHVALVQRDEDVAVAHQERLHARIGVNARGELARHRQGDGFLVLAAGADGAGVLAAVAGVNGDDEFALAAADDVLHRARRRGLAAGHRFAFGAQVQDQARAAAHALDAAARLHFTPQVEHHAQVAFGRLAGAHRRHDAVGRWRTVAGGKRGARKIQHQPVRVGQGENLVLGLARQLEHHARAAVRFHQLEALQLGRERRRGHQAQQDRDKQHEGGKSAHGRIEPP